MTPPHEMDVRERLLIAAKKLFARYGYDGTSVRQICEEAGANVALVSYHFGGKEKVFEEVLRTFLPVYRIAELDAVMNDPPEGIVLVITEVLRLGHKDPDLRLLLQIEIATRSPRLPVMQQVVMPFWHNVRRLLQQGKEQGHFRFESLDQALIMVIGTLFIHAKTHFFEPIMEEYPFQFERLVRETCRFVLAGLRYEGEMPAIHC